MQYESLGLEEEACLRLGKFIFAFAYLEVNLALCLKFAELRSQSGNNDSGTSNARSFAILLESLLEHIAEKFDSSTSAYASWTAWYMRADAIRELSNRFVHSRWVALWHKQVIVNVTGVMGETNQTEQFLSLSDLDLYVREVNVLQVNLSRLRNKFPIE